MKAIRLHQPGGPDQLRGDAVVINPSLNWGDREDRPSPGFKILGGPDPGTYAEFVLVP